MCFLKAFSKTTSFKPFAQSSGMPVYSCFDKGEIRSKTKGTFYENYRISIGVSEREWDDFPGQVQDAIVFLKNWFSQIQSLSSNHQIDVLFLDFPIYSRISDDIVNANDHLPSELIRLAGALGLGIEMAYYNEQYL